MACRILHGVRARISTPGAVTSDAILGSVRRIPVQPTVIERTQLGLNQREILSGIGMKLDLLSELPLQSDQIVRLPGCSISEGLAHNRIGCAPRLRKRTVEPRRSLPAEGIEPTRPCGHWILSPARLPVPPRRLIGRASAETTFALRPCKLPQKLIHATNWRVPILLFPSAFFAGLVSS